jgi:uncharacterized protein
VPQALHKLISLVRGAFVLALVGLIRVYQLLVSPLLGRRCRFYPSCSEYAAESVRHFGPLAGSWRALGRLCRCHPWNAGGFDPPVPAPKQGSID